MGGLIVLLAGSSTLSLAFALALIAFGALGLLVVLLLDILVFYGGVLCALLVPRIQMNGLL